uniref:Uncharacterized protein n=1 Tax=Rhizophora mucronata TaxID=61149 RepID=A0A2P2PTI2_RHIMU
MAIMRKHRKKIPKPSEARSGGLNNLFCRKDSHLVNK